MLSNTTCWRARALCFLTPELGFRASAVAQAAVHASSEVLPHDAVAASVGSLLTFAFNVPCALFLLSLSVRAPAACHAFAAPPQRLPATARCPRPYGWRLQASNNPLFARGLTWALPCVCFGCTLLLCAWKDRKPSSA